MFLEGPSGNIEILKSQATRSTTTAVLCHPHPQYGGSMHDGVLALAAGECEKANISTICFNFRGVGASEGHYDNGDGECHDLKAVLASIPEDQTIWLIGYSFGAHIVHKMVPQTRTTRALLIAPPVGMMNFEAAASRTNADQQLTAIAGDKDSYVDLQVLQDLVTAKTLKKFVGIEGADHFFSSHQQALTGALEDWMSEEGRENT